MDYILKRSIPLEHESFMIYFVKKMELLEPCGMGNPYPVFAIENLYLQEQKLIGQKQNHLKFVCVNQNKETLDCVFWNNSLLEIAQNSSIDIAFYPKINNFNNVETLQLDIQDAHYEKIKKNINIYDHRKKRNILSQVCDFVNKNREKIFVYTSNMQLKNELLKTGFPQEVFNQQDNIGHLMFFDYPENEETFKSLIEKLSPQNLHFMNCENNEVNLNDFIGKILGMIKYATHNKNGEFDIVVVSEILGINEQIIELTVNLLNETGAIKINSANGSVYNVEYLMPIAFDEVLTVDEFEELKSKLDSAKKFKQHILSVDEKELSQLVN